MPIFPSQDGSENTWGTELRNFFSPFFDLVTGLFRTNVIPGSAIQNATITDTQMSGVAWSKVDKTTSSIADIATKSHTLLTDVGTRTHPQLDSFYDSKAQASGLASLDGSSKVVQDPANATATPTANKIVISDAGGKVDSWVTDATISAKGKASFATADFTVTSGAVTINKSNNARPKFRATPAADQTITSGVETKVVFDTEIFDTNSNFATNTFTPTVAGYYTLSGSIYLAGTTLTKVTIELRKNGSAVEITEFYPLATSPVALLSISTSAIAANGTTDYFDIYACATGTGTILVKNVLTTFSGAMLP